MHSWTSTQGCPSLQRAALQPRCQRRATQSRVARKGEPRSLLGPYWVLTGPLLGPLLRSAPTRPRTGSEALCGSEIYIWWGSRRRVGWGGVWGGWGVGEASRLWKMIGPKRGNTRSLDRGFVACGVGVRSGTRVSCVAVAESHPGHSTYSLTQRVFRPLFRAFLPCKFRPALAS